MKRFPNPSIYYQFHRSLSFYLHNSHMRFALRSGADAACEKPLEENRVAVQTVADIRNMEPRGLVGDYHPFLGTVSR